MKKSEFLADMELYFFQLDEYVLTGKPAVLLNQKTGEKTVFSNMEEAYEKAMLGEKALREIVETNNTKFMEKHMFICLDDGGIRIA